MNGIEIVFVILAVMIILIRLHVVLNIELEKRKNNKQKAQQNNTFKMEKEAMPLNVGGEEKLSRAIVHILNGNVMKGYIRLSLHLLSHVPSHHFRKIVLKYLFSMHIGKKAVLYSWSEIRCPWLITVGDHSIIGDEVKLDGRNKITIGNNVNFSSGVWIWTEQHDVQSPLFLGEGGPVTIQDHAWVSCRTVILPNITIGEGAVVAAGAVVTKNCEAYSIYGGVPAKCIGERERRLTYEFNGSYLHFI